eukprot:c7489_g1_i1.p1 GENE.c7489_g1_i1~~c7489_g1_i1.p1  ORF type:complete len:449 (+),score=84.37 c7489_g1_i1:47-1393(+)
MDDEYDVVILGTGLKECILSGILSVTKHKVLHMDRNDYYGGESASLNLEQLYEHFRGKNAKPDDAIFGASRRAADYNIDLVPKLIMADGLLVKMLVFTQVYKYIDLAQVEGSYVYHEGKLEKVPANDAEALKSNMMSFFEKRRAHKFFSFVAQWSETDPKTHNGHNLHKMTMGELFAQYSLSDSTVDFIGHAIALQLDDSYLSSPAADTVLKMQLYFQSILRYGKSPYIYPLYGLGELPQAFARLSAVYGGTYMLRKPFEGIVTNEAGQVVGVRSENGEVAKCKFVVADPSYFPERVRKSGSIARCICFLASPPIKAIGSAQIIVPAKQVGRQTDIYISYVSSAHNVVPAGKYVAIVSALAETNDPIAELQPGLDLLGPILEKFPSVSDFNEPVDDGQADRVFISKSFDQTTHFETTCLDIMEMYKRITGKDLDLSVTDLEALQNSTQ